MIALPLSHFRLIARHRYAIIQFLDTKAKPSPDERKRAQKLKIRLQTLCETIGVLEKKLKEAKKQEKDVKKELKSIGHGEIFGDDQLAG